MSSTKIVGEQDYAVQGDTLRMHLVVWAAIPEIYAQGGTIDGRKFSPLNPYRFGDEFIMRPNVLSQEMNRLAQRDMEYPDQRHAVVGLNNYRGRWIDSGLPFAPEPGMRYCRFDVDVHSKVVENGPLLIITVVGLLVGAVAVMIPATRAFVMEIAVTTAEVMGKAVGAGVRAAVESLFQPDDQGIPWGTILFVLLFLFLAFWLLAGMRKTKVLPA